MITVRFKQRKWSIVWVTIFFLAISFLGQGFAQTKRANSGKNKTSSDLISTGYFNILTYGAKGDSSFLCTQAIKTAIEKASEQGGGTVYVPSGKFLTGPIHLKSNITLHLEAGAELHFTDDFDAYLPMVPSRYEGVDVTSFSPLIYANGAENIAITGRGLLNGNGKKWWHFVETYWEGQPRSKWQTIFDSLNRDILLPDDPRQMKRGFLRPPFIQTMFCKNIRITGVTIINSPFWTVNPEFSDQITIDGVIINNPNAPNTDGINPESCSNVHISNCHISVGDDCITIKSGKDAPGRKMNRPAENYTITNCTMLSGHGGVVIGSEMSGGVKKIVISNCIFDGTDRGIRLKTTRGRGGVVEDIRVSNIIMKNIRDQAIVLDMEYAKVPVEPKSERTPQFRNIHLSGITGNAKTAVFINGLEEQWVEDISFSDMQLQTTEGITLKNARRIQFRNVLLETKLGAAIKATNVENLLVSDACVKELQPGKPVFQFAHVRGANIRFTQVPSSVTQFIETQGQCEHIEEFQNEAHGVPQKIVSGNNQHQLWYQKPAANWNEALPIGNGKLGAMIFGGIAKEKLSLNEDSFWNGQPNDGIRSNAYKHLAEIRKLLQEGKQKEAESLASEEFMAMRVGEKEYPLLRTAWRNKVISEHTGALEFHPDSDKLFQRTLTFPLPNGWESAGYQGLDGALWFRTQFDMPADKQFQDWIIDLGKIRDEDFTWLNGKMVGNTQGAGENRRYKINGDVLKPGKNNLAVQVLNYFDKGGFTGRKEAEPFLYLVSASGKDTIHLSKTWSFTVQDSLPPAMPRFNADYQPLVDLIVTTGHHQPKKTFSYERRLNLQQAEASVQYIYEGEAYGRNFFSSFPDQVLVGLFTGPVSSERPFVFSLQTLHPGGKVRKMGPGDLELVQSPKNGAIKAAIRLRVITNGAAPSWRGDSIVVNSGDSIRVYLAAATNYLKYNDLTAQPEDTVAKRIQRAVQQSWASLQNTHRLDHQTIYNRFDIRLGEGNLVDVPTDERIKQYQKNRDPDLVALLTRYGRYLLIASSRPGTQPANLQGIWNELLLPPWGSKYTTNINLEMNYWPVYTLHLEELDQPFLSMAKDLVQQGKKTAAAFYKAPGWVLHHNTDIWRTTAPVNASNHGIWPTGSAWISTQLYEKYLFQRNKEDLKNHVFPIMLEAAKFYQYFLIKDPQTGFLISSPTNSPEQGGLVKGATMDHQMIRQLFKQTFEAAQILGGSYAKDPFIVNLPKLAAQIAPNMIGRYGQLQEWLTDRDDSTNQHRHVSHLWGVFPGYDIPLQQTNIRKAAEKSLIFRGNGGTGWSLAWKLNLWAHFRNEKMAMEILNNLLSPSIQSNGSEKGGVYLNLLDAHPPFQIDGNFGAAAGVVEMLVQSEPTLEPTIHLLPTLPGLWKDGQLRGVRIRGNVLLSFKWKNKRVEEFELISPLTQKVRLNVHGEWITVNLVANQSKKVLFPVKE